MKSLRNDLRRSKGQVLLATLLFCFIFTILFVGLYKSGMVYSLKERADRSCELTVLSAGAVYANGLQLVRLTNLFLAAFALIDLTVIAIAVSAASVASLGALAAVAIKADPHLRKIIQNLQKILFGIDIPVPGLYPLLIFTEGLSAAQRNQATDNWTFQTLLSLKFPLPPSPFFLFNPETAKPFWGSLVPNMALRFRTADQFIADLDDSKQKVYYQYRDKNGTYHYVEEKDTELAPHSQNPNQRRVKQGVPGSSKFLDLKPVLQQSIAGEAQSEIGNEIGKTGFSETHVDFGPLASLLKGVLMDVTDRDDPPNHTLVVYAKLPAAVQNTGSSSATIQALGEASVQGPGLAAWDIDKPSYQTRLVNLDINRLAEILGVPSALPSLLQSGQLHSWPNGFDPESILGVLP